MHIILRRNAKRVRYFMVRDCLLGDDDDDDVAIQKLSQWIDGNGKKLTWNAWCIPMFTIIGSVGLAQPLNQSCPSSKHILNEEPDLQILLYNTYEPILVHLCLLVELMRSPPCSLPSRDVFSTRYLVKTQISKAHSVLTVFPLLSAKFSTIYMYKPIANCSSSLID